MLPNRRERRKRLAFYVLITTRYRSHCRAERRTLAPANPLEFFGFESADRRATDPTSDSSAGRHSLDRLGFGDHLKVLKRQLTFARPRTGHYKVLFTRCLNY